MPKLYAEGSTKMNRLQPKKETVDFILNYSKALKVIKLKNTTIKLLQN